MADPDPRRDHPSGTELETIQDLDWQVATAQSEVCRVFLHNDEVTPWDFVVYVLRAIFFFSSPDAERITATAHFHGVAFVIALPFEEAKYRVGKAHSMARAANYPLTLSIELETE